MNFIIFFCFSILILFSVQGYGLIFRNFFLINAKEKEDNLGIIGIYGLFFLSIISGISYIFINHGYIHNLVINSLGFIYFIYFFLQKKINNRNLLIVIIFFIVLFSGFLIGKTNEDFPYYHLPNSLQFSEQKLQFGLGNLNHGFKHFSSLLLINSLFYLPFVKFYLFNITNFLFQIFFFSFLFIYLFEKNSSNFNKNFIALTLLVFLAKFNRLAEYGVDIPGQFLVLISFIISLETVLNKRLDDNYRNYNFLISIILLIFAISTKFAYSIYALIPLFLFINLKNKKKSIFFILKIKLFLPILISILLLIFFNFSSTGCLIYPISITCFSNTFDWSLNLDVVQYMNLHYEAWAKAGKGTGFNLENLPHYVSGLNWLGNWLEIYFFNKISDYILLIFFILLLYFIYFYRDFKSKYNIESYKNVFIFYFFILIILLIWFTNFPTLRYAGYTIVYLFLVIPACVFLSKKIFWNKSVKINKKFIYLLVLSIVIFNFRNVQRIYNESSLDINKDNNFSNFPYFFVKKVNYEELEIDNHKVFLVKQQCWATPSTCVRSKNIKIQNKYGYIIYIKK